MVGPARIDKTGYMYCARAGKYVKIGFSKNPNKRLKYLRDNTTKRYSYPSDAPLEEIKLEAQIATRFSKEIEFHWQFRGERIYGTREWYPIDGKAHNAFWNSPGCEVASIHNSLRKVHAGGRPRGCRKCPKCGKFHKQEEMLKCQG